MSTAQLTDLYQLELEYSSFQLKRFLLNTCLNRGNRLQPNKVDPMVHVIAKPFPGENVDPYISEVPDFIKSISWSIKEESKLESQDIKNATLCFIEFYSLDPHHSEYPDKKYWKKYFQLNDYSTVAPNGTLFQAADDNQQISLPLKDDRKSLLFGYGVVFTVDVCKEDGKWKTYYCRIDPIANIRSSDG